MSFDGAVSIAQQSASDSLLAKNQKVKLKWDRNESGTNLIIIVLQ